MSDDRYIVDLAGTKKGSFKIGATYAVLMTRLIAGTSGEITGGGNLGADLTLGLATSGVVSGTYGDAATVPRMTVDTKGRVTAVVNTTITPAGIGAAAAAHTHSFASITAKPTTIVGYGITDVQSTIDSSVAAHAAAANPHPVYVLTSANIAWSKITSTPTTVAGYGILDAVADDDSRLTNARTPSGAAGGSLTGTYPNPTIAASAVTNVMISASAAVAWSKIDKSGAVPADVGAAAASHTQAWSTITSTPTTRSGYGITDAAGNAITITGTKSLTGGGDLTANRTLELVGDQTSPGASMHYGTNSSGVRGWYSFGLVTSGIVGTLTLSKTGTTARTVTFQDATGTVALVADLSAYQPVNSTLSALASLGIGVANTVLVSNGSAPAWSTSLALSGGVSCASVSASGADAVNTAIFAGTTGQLRVRGYTDATYGSVLIARNTADSAYVPITLAGSVLLLSTTNGVALTLNNDMSATFAGGVACATLTAVTHLSAGTPAGGQQYFDIFADNTNFVTVMQGQKVGVGYTTLNINPNGGAVVIGTDPGGSELLRVGGAGRFTGTVTLANSTAGASYALTNDSYGQMAKWQRFGYSDAYTTLQIGHAGRGLALGIDPSVVPGGSFVGAGGEFLVPRGLRAICPNAGGTDWELASLSIGTLALTGKISSVSAVPASFADLAAVRTWLAAQFT